MLISRVMFYKVSAQERERIVKLDDFRTKIEVIYNNRLRKHEIRKITQIYEQLEDKRNRQHDSKWYLRFSILGDIKDFSSLCFVISQMI